MSKIVGRTLDFFELFAREKRPMTLSEIGRLLGIPASSCHDMLTTLRKRGYVYEPKTGMGYYPTLRLLQITEAIASVDLTLEDAEEPLRSLATQTGETVSLSRVDEASIIRVMLFTSPHPFGITPQIGTSVQAHHASAAGKAYLGSLPEDQRHELLHSSELERITPHTVTDPDEVLAEVNFSERRGWFINREASIEGVTSVAARFTSREVTYIVTVAGPSVRIQPKIDIVAQQLTETCIILGQKEKTVVDFENTISLKQ